MLAKCRQNWIDKILRCWAELLAKSEGKGQHMGKIWRKITQHIGSYVRIIVTILVLVHLLQISIVYYFTFSMGPASMSLYLPHASSTISYGTTQDQLTPQPGLGACSGSCPWSCPRPWPCPVTYPRYQYHHLVLLLVSHTVLPHLLAVRWHLLEAVLLSLHFTNPLWLDCT